MGLIHLDIDWDGERWLFARRPTEKEYSAELRWDAVGIVKLAYNTKPHTADKIESLLEALREVKQEEGDIFEAGVCHGNSLFALSYAAYVMGLKCMVIGCDPGAQPEEDLMPYENGAMWKSQKQSVDELLATLKQFHCNNVGFYPMKVQDVKHEGKLRLMHADTDTYAGTLASLWFARARGCPITVVDDYTSKNCLGVAKAVAEFQEAVPEEYTLELRGEHAILRYKHEADGTSQEEPREQRQASPWSPGFLVSTNARRGLEGQA